MRQYQLGSRGLKNHFLYADEVPEQLHPGDTESVAVGARLM